MNRPGILIDNLVGGVVKGSIVEGILSVGMEVEIKPGRLWRDGNGEIRCTSIKSKVVSLKG